MILMKLIKVYKIIEEVNSDKIEPIKLLNEKTNNNIITIGGVVF